MSSIRETRRRNASKRRIAGKSGAVSDSAAPAGDREWRLPSGVELGDFALQAGFLAPSLLRLGAATEDAGAAEDEQGSKLAGAKARR